MRGIVKCVIGYIGTTPLVFSSLFDGWGGEGSSRRNS